MELSFRSWDTNLKVRFFGEALFHMLFWMYFPFITVYFGMTLGHSAAGLLMTIPPIFAMIGSLLGGAVADRRGRRPAMLLGAALQAAMFVAFAASWSPWIDYAAFIGLGFGGAVYRPASSAMVADLVPADDRRRMFAAFATANNVGAVLGPVVGAVLFFRYRDELLWTCAVVSLLYTLAIYRFVRETMPSGPATPERTKSFLSDLREQWRSYGIILKDKVFFVYILAGIFALVTIMQLDLYLSVYISQHVPAQSVFGGSEERFVLSGTDAFGWLVGFNGLLFVLFVLPVTKWLRRWKDRNVFILSSLLSGVGTFAVGWRSELWYLLVVTLVFTFGEIVRSPVSQSFISRYAPEHARGQYMGADGLQYTIGKFIAPTTVFMSAWVPPRGIFLLILASALASVALYAQLFRLEAARRADFGEVDASATQRSAYPADG